MPVKITGGTIHRRGLQIGLRRDGALHSEEITTQSSGVQIVNLTTDLTTFSGGTSTGEVDRYTLANGTEGHLKQLLMLATGEAIIDYNGTATRLIFTEADDYVSMEFKKAKWRVLRNIASATSVENTQLPVAEAIVTLMSPVAAASIRIMASRGRRP